MRGVAFRGLLLPPVVFPFWLCLTGFVYLLPLLFFLVWLPILGCGALRSVASCCLPFPAIAFLVWLPFLASLTSFSLWFHFSASHLRLHGILLPVAHCCYSFLASLNLLASHTGFPSRRGLPSPRVASRWFLLPFLCWLSLTSIPDWLPFVFVVRLPIFGCSLLPPVAAPCLSLPPVAFPFWLPLLASLASFLC